MAEKFINANTGCVMYVEADRVDEYLRLGHKRASVDEVKVEKKATSRKPKKKAE